jgi:hypothetical protein
VLYVGSSNFAGWHIAQAQESAKARMALKKLDELFPGPGGPAPEAYAW